MTLRVVLVANWMHDVGGVQTATRSLGSALTAAGCEVRLVSLLPSPTASRRSDVHRTAHPRGPLLEPLRHGLGRRGGGTLPARLDLPGRIVGRRRLRSILRAADRVVVMDVYAAEAAVRAGSKAPVIAQFHNSAASLEGTRDLARLKRAAPKLASLVALTEADAERFRARGFSAVTSIPNIVERHAVDVRRERTVLGLGRFTSVKRFDLLIAAWQSLGAEERGDWRLEIRGGGPEQASLERAARDDSSIVVAGASEDVPNLLGRARLLVLPSDFEGLPMVLLEAMAADVACIATRSSVGVEQLLDGAGWLVPVGDHRALRAALIDAMTDEAAVDRAVDEGRRRAEDYGPSRLANRWLDLFDLVAAS